MKVVKVYGALRELLGKTRFEFVADTPAQAMRALLVNFPQLEQWLVDSEKKWCCLSGDSWKAKD